jgi:hypothetical protein
MPEYWSTGVSEYWVYLFDPSPHYSTTPLPHFPVISALSLNPQTESRSFSYPDPRWMILLGPPPRPKGLKRYYKTKTQPAFLNVY